MLANASLFSNCYADTPALHSFPTRRSSDLAYARAIVASIAANRGHVEPALEIAGHGRAAFAFVANGNRDRKSTRLNSSHLGISYAVFSLKKTMTKAACGSGNLLATPDVLLH